MSWQPIETAPRGKYVILYQPDSLDSRGKSISPARMVIEYWPTTYPRKSSHWMPLPDPPEEK